MAENGPLFGNFKLTLRSAICHRGTRVDEGHYIGLVRTYDPKRPGDDRWLRHDDLAKERVIEVDIEQFLRNETPYILFYQVVPIDGDPGNIAEGEMADSKDQPPPYSEEWGIEAEANANPDQTPSIEIAGVVTYGISEPRTSNSSDRKRSIAISEPGSTVVEAEPGSRKLAEDDGNTSKTASHRSSQANGFEITHGLAAQPEPSRLSASMSRLTSRLTKDKTEVGPSITPRGPSLEGCEAPGVNGKGRLKKEKSKSKLRDHQHPVKGRGKIETPDRECILM